MYVCMAGPMAEVIVALKLVQDVVQKDFDRVFDRGLSSNSFPFQTRGMMHLVMVNEEDKSPQRMESPPGHTHHLPTLRTLHSTIPSKKMLRHIAQSQLAFPSEIEIETQTGDLGVMWYSSLGRRG